MVKSDSYSNPRFFFNGTFRPDDFAKKATVSEKPLQPPSLRPWPSLVPEQDVTHHLLMKAVNLAQSIITSREGIDAMAALALKLNEIAPNDIVVDGSENDGGLAQAYRTEGWEYDVARNFAQSLMASWPDVMVDEEMQWPTNFANIERRSWSGEFDPRKFLIRLNAPVSVIKHRSNSQRNDITDVRTIHSAHPDDVSVRCKRDILLRFPTHHHISTRGRWPSVRYLPHLRSVSDTSRSSTSKLLPRSV